MTPKPLSKERLAEISELSMTFDARASDLEEAVDDLLAAEQFWREAVKNAQECPSDACAFCSDSMAQFGHKPGCLWLLAQ